MCARARGLTTDGFWPGPNCQLLSEQWLDGFRVLCLRVYPLQYDARQRALYYARHLTVRVWVSGAAEEDSRRGPTPGPSQRLAEMVDNPQQLATFGRQREDTACALATQGSSTVTQGLVDPAAPCDYVLITHRDLFAAFQPLVDWRRGQGLSVGVYDIGDILASYPGDRPAGGVDDATRLRNFLSDAYGSWRDSEHPLQYVLLGGDSEIIPVRTLYVRAGIYETSDHQPLVSDAYYAGLDGNWDADADGLYGEGDAQLGGTGEAGEEADLFAEVAVGRVPANLGPAGEVDREARNWVAKLLAYENDPLADYMDRAVWVGERLDAKTYGGDSVEEILPLVPALNVVRLYDALVHWSADQLVGHLNAGAHMVNHLGHANASGVMRLTAQHVAGLTNAERPCIVHSQGCLAAAISTPNGEAIAEPFLTAQGGAVAFVGNTAYGWYAPGSTDGASQTYDLGFIDAIYREGIVNLGWALQDAREDAIGAVGAVGPERWVYLELILLGDPYTPVVTGYADPVAAIAEPAQRQRLAGQVDIRGQAHAGGAEGASFDSYELHWGTGLSPAEWHSLPVDGGEPVEDEPLGSWDVGLLDDGGYTLRLRVSDGAGLLSEDQQVVRVAHTIISVPVANSYLPAGGVLDIHGTAYRPDLSYYRLEAGKGALPEVWQTVVSATAPVMDGLLGQWDTASVVEAGSYSLRLSVKAEGYAAYDTVTLALDPLYQRGWPQQVQNRLSNASLAIGDLDGDGDLEVVASEGMRLCGGALPPDPGLPQEGLEGGRCGAYGMLVYAWDHEGQLLPGWPVMPGSDNRLSSPALANLDDAPGLEVVVASIDGAVYVYRQDGVLRVGWPQKTPGQFQAPPACGDLDGDGVIEIVACTSGGTAYAWHAGGQAVEGWPQKAPGSSQTPLLADLDDDGADEVIVSSSDGSVRAWRGDGTGLPGWPVAVRDSLGSSPLAGDLDGDGTLEVVVIGYDGAYAWHADGKPVDGWPVMDIEGASGTSPALADLDGDGRLEILWASRTGGICALRADGTRVDGWCSGQPYTPRSSLVVADLDGDGAMEVVVVGPDGSQHLYVYDHTGQPLVGWPRAIPARDVPHPAWERQSSGTLIDLDGDGDLELGLGVETYVFFWDLPASAQQSGIWSTLHGDMRRSGATAPTFTYHSFWPEVWRQADQAGSSQPSSAR